MGSVDCAGSEITYQHTIPYHTILYHHTIPYISYYTTIPYHTIPYKMKSATILLSLLSTVLSQNSNRIPSFSREEKHDVDVVEPEELSLFARLVGEETQARVIESISTWANDKAKENPGCVERFVCETYKTGETMSGIPYLLMSLTNAAVRFMVAEQFGEAIEMEAITRAAKYGRTAEDRHGLLGGLRGDARVHCQLGVHLNRKVRSLQPNCCLPETK